MTQIESKDALVMEYCEPVLFRSDSSQRKNDVLIHQSKLFPDKCSEWYFVRRNKNTRNETYRCVHCRSVHEKARRRKNASADASEVKGDAAATDPALTGDTIDADPVPTTDNAALRPGARIVVHKEFFIINPDYPLGAHICDFENNPASDSHVVWSRRALIRANSELRLNPEKPKVKFQQMLESIERGDGEYAYLSTQLRKNIVEHLTSKKGFDSRRRSFARNNSMALKRMRERQLREELYAGDPAFGGYTGDDRHSLSRYDLFAEGGGAPSAPTTVYRAIRQVTAKCGMPGCNMTFRSEADRAHHRLVIHPGVYFVDSYDEFTEYRDLMLESNGRYADEVITTEYGRIVDVGVFERQEGGQPALDFYVVDEQRLDHYDDYENAHYYEDEGVELKSTLPAVLGSQQIAPTAIANASMKVTSKLSNGQRSSVADSSAPILEQQTATKTSSSSNFLGQIDSMLTQIHKCAVAVANYPIRRDTVENTIHNVMNECMRDVRSVDEAKSQGGCQPPMLASPSLSAGQGTTTFRRGSSSGFYDFDDESEADGSSYGMTVQETSFYAPMPKRKRPNILSVQKV